MTIQTGSFKQVCKIPTDYGMTLTKYKSANTGLTVMVADIEEPMVNGYFALATESFDDYGCPHTLEHLVFLGSEQYPYKGVLDSLANRAIAQGTNAWTDIDHTCYTIATAGSQGFLRLLPIYVDHILYPTLTESGYYTEVHHVNGEGEDAGVVYSEIQGCQNSAEFRLQLHMRRILYPEGCGYRYETGGLMERLRELSVEKIREYHKAYYRPDNLCLVITGTVDHTAVLEALDPVEKNILSKGPLPKVPRPWVDSKMFPNLTESVTETVLFPDEDESMGTVRIAWNGPLYNEYLEAKAIDVIRIYLTRSPVSVLRKEFVEVDNPICTDVTFYATDDIKTTLVFVASSVPTHVIDDFPRRLFNVLQRIVDTDGIDMKRMATLIDVEILQLYGSAETKGHELAATKCISDFLYGSVHGEDLQKSVRDKEYLEILSQYKEADWIRILKKWYLDAPRVTLLGRPSAAFADQLATEERIRVEKQQKELGETKMQELQQKLKDALATNDVSLPHDIVESFSIPKVSSINFINVVTARNNDQGISNPVQDYVNKDNGADVPLFIQFDHVQSQFVKITAHISASDIPARLLPYASLLFKTLFSLPIVRDGVTIPYEDVVKGLNEDTTEYHVDLGSSSGFFELVVLTLKGQASKFPKIVQWLKDIMWHTQFTTERLRIAATRILNDLPLAKRSGYSVVNALRSMQYDSSKSIYATRNILFQSTFIQSVLQKLDDNPASVLEDMNTFRQALCQTKNIRLHVTGNILSLQNPRTTFAQFCSPLTTELAPITLAQHVLSPNGLLPGKIGLIVELPTIESSFSHHTAKGPSRFDDPDIPALLVAIELLDTMEGILWKFIRGQGLAYSTFLTANVEAGTISFAIHRSPNVFKAFEQAKYVFDQLVSGKMEIEQAAVEGAKSGVIYSMVARENSMDRAASLSFVNQVLKQVSASYSRDLLAAIQTVTLGDLHRVMNAYFTAMFTPQTSNMVIVSTPNKVEEIQNSFKLLGFTLETKSLNDFSGPTL